MFRFKGQQVSWITITACLPPKLLRTKTKSLHQSQNRNPSSANQNRKRKTRNPVNVEGSHSWNPCSMFITRHLSHKLWKRNTTLLPETITKSGHCSMTFWAKGWTGRMPAIYERVTRLCYKIAGYGGWTTLTGCLMCISFAKRLMEVAHISREDVHFVQSNMTNVRSHSCHECDWEHVQFLDTGYNLPTTLCDFWSISFFLFCKLCYSLIH